MKTLLHSICLFFSWIFLFSCVLKDQKLEKSPNLNIEDAFMGSSACDPDHKNWIENKYPYEVTRNSIFFPGDGSVPTMIVVLKAGKVTACQHIDFGIETDGYHYYDNGIWKIVGEKKWQEMYKTHLDLKMIGAPGRQA